MIKIWNNRFFVYNYEKNYEKLKKIFFNIYVN